jgi:DNA-binding beta-propeller fold protein YncE
MSPFRGVLSMLRMFLWLYVLSTATFFPSASHAEENQYRVLVVEEMLGRVILFESGQPQSRVSVSVGFRPHEIAMSSDGKTAYVANFGLDDVDNRKGIPGATISVIDVARARVRLEFHLPGSLKAPHCLAARPVSGQELFTNAERGDEMVVFDSDTGKVKRHFPLPQEIHCFVFSRDGSAVFAFSSKGAVYRIDPDTGKVLATNFGFTARGLAWTANADQLLLFSKSEITMVNPVDLIAIKRLPLPGSTQTFYGAASPDGRFFFAPAALDGEVNILDARTGSIVRRVHTGSPLRVIVAPDSTAAYVVNVGPAGDHLTIIRLPSLEPVDIYGFHQPNGLAFSPVFPSTAKDHPGTKIALN